MKRTVHLFLAGAFTAFAALNLHDPDPWLWLLAYLSVAVLFALAAFGRADRRVSGALCVALAVWMCTMLPGLVDWVLTGMPSIVSSMKATEPHVEVVREFLGLFIAVVCLLVLTLRTSKHARIGSSSTV